MDQNTHPSTPPAAESPRQYLPALSEPTRILAEERIIEVTITTRARDREGDVVEPGGLDFTAYLQNPVVLWAHDLTSAPVGRVRAITVCDDRVDATVQFAQTRMGREIFTLYAERYLNAWSIGFLPRRWAPLRAETADDRAPRGMHILEAEVVELSAVPVPANPEALTRALAQGEVAMSAPVRRCVFSEAEGSTPPDAAATSPGRAPVRQGVTLPIGDLAAAARQRAVRLLREELVRAAAVARGGLGPAC
jgi:HK97 family phage prohead protease